MVVELETSVDLLCRYLEEESDEVVTELLEKVRFDGFATVIGGVELAEETLVLKVLSHALVKVVAIIAERSREPDLAGTYMSIVPFQVDILKYLLLKEMRGSKSQ